MNPQESTAEVRKILLKKEFDQADVDVLVNNIEQLTIEEKVRLLFMITGYKILSNNPRNFSIEERIEAGEKREPAPTEPEVPTERERKVESEAEAKNDGKDGDEDGEKAKAARDAGKHTGAHR